MREEYHQLHGKFWCHVNSSLRSNIDSPSSPSLSESVERIREAHGWQEEFYRRISAVYRTIADVFPLSQWLIKAFLSRPFYEHVLDQMSNDLHRKRHINGTVEILEPFDAYLVAPTVIASIGKYLPDSLHWVVASLRYEWLVFQTARVASGWPAQVEVPPLVPGAGLVSADYDMDSLHAELRRMERAQIDMVSFTDRMVPSKGRVRKLIFPRDGQVCQVDLDDESFRSIEESILQQKPPDAELLSKRLSEIGAILECSFLCCSNEFACENSDAWTQRIIPESH